MSLGDWSGLGPEAGTRGPDRDDEFELAPEADAPHEAEDQAQEQVETDPATDVDPETGDVR